MTGEIPRIPVADAADIRRVLGALNGVPAGKAMAALIAAAAWLLVNHWHPVAYGRMRDLIGERVREGAQLVNRDAQGSA